MKQYVKKRLIGFLIVLIGVSILSFLLIAFSGNDPAEIVARRANINASEEMIEATRVELGLDESLPIQYLNWLKGFFTGDIGASIYSFREISLDLSEYFPVTFALVGMALLWIVVLSVPVSLLCARFRNQDGIHDNAKGFCSDGFAVLQVGHDKVICIQIKTLCGLHQRIVGNGDAAHADIAWFNAVNAERIIGSAPDVLIGGQEV